MPAERPLTPSGARLREALLRSGSSLTADGRVMSLALSEIRRAFGGRDDAPSLDQLRIALRVFFAGHQELSPTQIRYVCHGVAVPLDEQQGGRLIDDSALFESLMALLGKYERQERRFRKFYQGLLQGYFSFTNDAGPQSNAQINWTGLRRYLDEHLPALHADARRRGIVPEWLDTLRDHANLLTDDPCSRYASHLATGETAELTQVFDGLGIDSNSWVWEEVVMAYVRSVCERDDAGFQDALGDVLAYVNGRAHIKLPQLLAVRAAALVVRRYSDCRERPEHERLRDACLTLIGNPWIDPTAWDAHVNHEPARQMVEGWLKRRLIRDFFELLAKDGAADLRRLNYWLKWEPEISDMWFVLGRDAQRNKSAAFTNVRKRMAGKDRRLTDATDDNNAFVMRIGSLLVVEFGVTGNACYAFEASRFPVDLDAPAFSLYAIKNRRVAALWLSHSGYSWEQNFDVKLRGLLRTTPVTPVTPVAPRATATQSRAAPTPPRRPSPTPPPVPNTSNRPAGPFDGLMPRVAPPLMSPPPEHPAAPLAGVVPRDARRTRSESFEHELRDALSLCEASGFEWEDNRSNGGALWVLLEQRRQRPHLANRLDALGFEFKPGQGFWLK
ncbi:EH signature domain-containing protein [Caballeronia sp. LZ035]|uniref:EH signature domain-containing protein n=1 Tax=Caballeronia sp. LZ035 TaxID=3038568 RepID=UPI002854D13C|nr:EH signature domain-containing protein [Caballeronia sp. LZ035]MDR5761469.1 EH signature domain-containing protein [Caballeronia sp. LZ035]